MENVMGVVMLIHLASLCVSITTFAIGIIKKDFLMRTLCSVSCTVIALSGFTLEAYKDDIFWMMFWIVLFFINLSSAKGYYRYWIMQKAIEQMAKNACEDLKKETEKLNNKQDNSKDM